MELEKELNENEYQKTRLSAFTFVENTN